MNVNVDDLIYQAETEKARVEQDRATQIAALKEKADQAVKDFLDGAWDELALYGKPIAWDEPRHSLTLSLTVTWAFCPDALKLAPFYVVTSVSQNGTASTKFCLTPSLTKIDLPLAEFLHNRRLAYPEYMDSVRKERTTPLVEQLRRYSNITRTQAQDIVKKLDEIWPDRKTEWARKHAEWLDAFEEYERRMAREQLEREQHDRERASFVADWEVYTREYAETLERNREKLAKFQEQIDTPYSVCRLVYALALNGEDERYSTTREVFVSLGSSPANHFEVIHRGHLTGRTYLTGVSLDDPIKLHPTENHPTAGALRVEEADSTLFYAPGEPDVPQRLAALGLEPLPEKPAAPEWMDSYETRQITGLC